MPQKTAPTKQLIMETTGSNQGLISGVHHGLYEAPLTELYSNLDLDEVIAFSASSWQTRNRSSYDMKQILDNNDIYGVFTEIFKIGMPWLNKYKNISNRLQAKCEGLNPFNGKDLRGRLERVDERAVETLKQKLTKETKEYVFHCQYQGRKMARGGDNSRLEIMNFQNVYPKSEKIVPAFAGEVSKMIAKYPRDYVALEDVDTNPVQEPVQPEANEQDQFDLFN